MGGGFLNCAKSRELKSGLSIGISSVMKLLFGVENQELVVSLARNIFKVVYLNARIIGLR